MKQPKNYTYVLVILFVISSFSFIFPPDDGLKKIVEKLKTYTTNYPQEKIYLHIDKPVYALGEEIWFKAYLVNASFHTPDSLSKVIYVELWSPENKISLRHTLKATYGYAIGDFHLSDTLKEGVYTLRAYTNYMKNTTSSFFFHQNIRIVNPNSSVQGENEVARGPIDLQFFPESGNLLMNIDNKVAFKAITYNGKSVDIEGEIVDEKDSVVCNFKSTHKGMGSVTLKPLAGKVYNAKIKNHKNTLPIYPLPNPASEGFTIKISEVKKSLQLTLFNSAAMNGSDIQVHLVAHSRGVPTHAVTIPLQGMYSLLIPTSKFPTGITTFTLFDKNLTPLAERLVFIDHHDNLQVNLTSNKQSFKKREKVELSVEVKDILGNPSAGNFSVSVYDNNADVNSKYSSSIINYLLLSSDLKGHIEEPGYYFKDSLPETSQHLDLVMLTHGWRRFIWQDVFKDSVEVKNLPEQGLSLTGQLLKGLNKPAGDSKIKIVTQEKDFALIDTDSKGRFYIQLPDIYDSSRLYLQTQNSKGLDLSYKLKVDPNQIYPETQYPKNTLPLLDSIAFIKQSAERKQVEDAIKLRNGEIRLAEVLVEGKKVDKKAEERALRTSMYGNPDQRVEIAGQTAATPNVLMGLQGRVPGLTISGSMSNPSVNIRGLGSPLFLIDGIAADVQRVSSLSPSDVEFIDILKGAKAAVYGSRASAGAIAVYTKRGNGGNETAGSNEIKFLGFYKSRVFYSPKYDVQQAEHKNPDVRTTLFWSSNVSTDALGKAQITFYTSDITSTYKIVLEGISNLGVPGVAYHSISVKEGK